MTSKSSATCAPAPGVPAAAPDRRGVVRGQERQELALRFGTVLRAERFAQAWTQAQLAQRAGLARCTVERLERGAQRPSTTVTWKLATALRGGLDVPGTLALDARLRAAAGRSLREFSVRTQRKRERLAAKHLSGHGFPVAETDDFGALAVAMLAVADA